MGRRKYRDDWSDRQIRADQWSRATWRPDSIYWADVVGGGSRECVRYAGAGVDKDLRERIRLWCGADQAFEDATALRLEWASKGGTSNGLTLVVLPGQWIMDASGGHRVVSAEWLIDNTRGRLGLGSREDLPPIAKSETSVPSTEPFDLDHADCAFDVYRPTIFEVDKDGKPLPTTVVVTHLPSGLQVSCDAVSLSVEELRGRAFALLEGHVAKLS